MDCKAEEIIDELLSALSSLADQADEDCPAEYRSKHFRLALEEAYILLDEHCSKGGDNA